MKVAWLCGVILFAVGGVLLSSLTMRMAAAIEGTLQMESATTVVGETVEVRVIASVPEAPGLGAWTIDIAFDPAILTVDSCARGSGSICNPEFASGLARITGANPDGVVGTFDLDTFGFQCIAGGTSYVTLTLITFADATVGNPQAIDTVVHNGNIDCIGTKLSFSTLSDGGGHVLRATGLEAPGLGRWSVRVRYQGAEVVSCSPLLEQAACADNPAQSTVEITGESLAGIVGEESLATIHVGCRKQGTVPLMIDVVEFVDTEGVPIPVHPEHGAAICAQPRATPTRAPVLPPAGTGSSPDVTVSWLGALLVLGGAGLVAASAALRRRA
jgi:hypothetical protein